jgi:hypothetical protein
VGWFVPVALVVERVVVTGRCAWSVSNIKCLTVSSVTSNCASGENGS